MKHGNSFAVALGLAGLLLGRGVEAAPQKTFAVGTIADSVDLTRARGSFPFGDGAAIPLIGARPEWLTHDLLKQVLAAEGQPVAAPNDAPLPSEVGIRPGAWMIEPHGCTMNFIFAKDGTSASVGNKGKKRGKQVDPEPGALAIGTAGHCVDKVGDHVVILTLAPGTENPVLVDIGTVIIKRDNGIGDDFALVLIRPELYSWVSPTTALIGGPCGSYLGSGPEIVAHYGHGVAIGTGGTPRAGLALNWTDTAYGWDGLGIFGDSGSPVRVSDFKAAGNLTHLVVDPEWLPSFIAGTRITRMLEIAQGWFLLDSPLCVDLDPGL